MFMWSENENKLWAKYGQQSIAPIPQKPKPERHSTILSHGGARH